MDKDSVTRTIDTYDVIAKSYTRANASIKPYQEFLDLFLSHVGEPSLGQQKHILDSGCGPGLSLAYFCKKGYAAYGFDLSEGQLALARKNAPDAKLYKLDMRDFSKNVSFQFDGILSMASLLHIPKEQCPLVLSEFNKTLKDDGTLAIALRGGSGESYEEETYTHSGHARFFAYYTISELRELLNKQGFRVTYGTTIQEQRRNFLWINLLAKKGLEETLKDNAER